jgi:hypothetical protein
MNVLARLRNGQISNEPDVETTVDFAGVREDAVVLMGEEIVEATILPEANLKDG